MLMASIDRKHRHGEQTIVPSQSKHVRLAELMALRISYKLKKEVLMELRR